MALNSGAARNSEYGVQQKMPLWGKYCDGGHFCSAPKECCTLGCCYHPPQTNRMFNLLFLGHWYFWAIVTVAIVCLLCFCSLWRRCRVLFHILCCFMSNRDERASEPDSTGSFYAPPHYSRCNSFHHAPPPYTEVTSKPDLYPLVISYNGDTGMKRGGSTSYLMVQYFRNYILRPSGSISATSTIDSLSSSFICNAVNEANTIVPPPYSCTGSLDGFSITANTNTVPDMQMLHSVSSVMFNEYQQTHCSSVHSQQSINGQLSAHNSPSGHSLNTHNSAHSPNYVSTSNRTSPVGISSTTSSSQRTISNNPNYLHNKTTSFVNNITSKNGTCHCDTNETQLSSYSNAESTFKLCSDVRKNDPESCFHTVQKKPTHALVQRKNLISTDNSMDSETSQGDDHNFSELLNLSVCAPSSIINCDVSDLSNMDFETHPNLSELAQSYSIANSITVSDISSLANLGTPDSPPRATSPTVEIREILDKIQQLPQHKSPTVEYYNSNENQPPSNSRFFVRNKSKTLYMPLNSALNKVTPNPKQNTGIFGGSSNIFSYAGKTTRSWLSRSAPTTPCSNFAPLFPSQRKNNVSGSQKGSKMRVDDGSALLEGIDYDPSNTDECL